MLSNRKWRRVFRTILTIQKRLRIIPLRARPQSPRPKREGGQRAQLTRRREPRRRRLWSSRSRYTRSPRSRQSLRKRQKSLKGHARRGPKRRQHRRHPSLPEDDRAALEIFQRRRGTPRPRHASPTPPAPGRRCETPRITFCSSSPSEPARGGHTWPTHTPGICGSCSWVGWDVQAHRVSTKVSYF